MSNFPKKQKQLAQLEIVFAGPLIKDSIVNDLSELILLNVNYNYEHKIVWVKSEESNYYLYSGDGSILNNWKKHSTKLILEQYTNKTYQEGETVYLSGKIFKATQNVPLLYNPLDYPAYWLTISGESLTHRYIFINQSNVLVYTDIKNPLFEIILGTFEQDVDLNYLLDSTGLIKINDQEIVEAYIKRRDDLPNDNGVPYEIIFESNLNPIGLVGVINIK